MGEKKRNQMIKELNKEFNGKFLELRKLINSYELIPHAPSDEFDALIHKILSHLYRGADLEIIKSVLDSELSIYYGLYTNEFDSDDMASEIIQWWES